MPHTSYVPNLIAGRQSQSKLQALLRAVCLTMRVACLTMQAVRLTELLEGFIEQAEGAQQATDNTE